MTFYTTVLLLQHSAGRMNNDGKLHVTLCQFIEAWEDLSETQKKGLTQRYEMGCGCKVE